MTSGSCGESGWGVSVLQKEKVLEDCVTTLGMCITLLSCILRYGEDGNFIFFPTKKKKDINITGTRDVAQLGSLFPFFPKSSMTLGWLPFQGHHCQVATNHTGIHKHNAASVCFLNSLTPYTLPLAISLHVILRSTPLIFMSVKYSSYKYISVYVFILMLMGISNF